MRVTACKNIDVEFTTDVDLDDVIREAVDNMDSHEDGPRMALSGLDSVTKIIERLGVRVLESRFTSESVKAEIAKTLRQRLAAINKWIDQHARDNT